jgi:thiazole/oxazole-forming peptide maturase SagD family component
VEVASSALYADPRWLLAVVPEGLVAVGPELDVEVSFEASLNERQRLLDALGEGVIGETVAELTGASPDESEALLAELAEPGVIGPLEPRQEPPAGAPLIDALLMLNGTGELPDLIWTAEEALLVPPGLLARQRRKLLRSFIAGIRPSRRRLAYCHAARWMRATVRGDVPDGERIAELMTDRLDPAAIHVLDLGGGEPASLAVDELETLGAHHTHRLGPIIEVRQLEAQGERLGAAMFAAEYATPNLAHPGDGGLKCLGRGIAPEAGLAETIARAEAVERYAAGELSGRELVRAKERELPGAVPGDSLLRLNRRQYAESDLFAPYDPESEYLWTPARASDGSARWVLAELVHFPFADWVHERSFALVSSSGLAAHYDPSEAARRALCELVERDAFMWTWVQRVSRERISRSSLPDAVRGSIGRLNRAGWDVDLVNLTMETHPVIFCAIHDEETLSIAAACDPVPARAVAKCLMEAASHAFGTEGPPIEARSVEDPADHSQLYRSAELVEHASFMFASPREVELHEVTARSEPIEQLLTQFGEPLTVDLTCSASSPLHVVRALVPGTIPISFGWDREPLGLPLLGRTRTTADGGRIGAELDLDTSGPLMPHPFA